MERKLEAELDFSTSFQATMTRQGVMDEQPTVVQEDPTFPLKLQAGSEQIVNVDGRAITFRVNYPHTFHDRTGLEEHARRSIDLRYDGLTPIAPPEWTVEAIQERRKPRA